MIDFEAVIWPPRWIPPEIRSRCAGLLIEKDHPEMSGTLLATVAKPDKGQEDGIASMVGARRAGGRSRSEMAIIPRFLGGGISA
jgi:hypothetical protein